ncbi:MAG TPA: peptidoglycan-binding domain-containing protein [Chthoniobacterales bacterium]|nr:peptidoglycan-binding domain-containing protein [Chthoniobacterales bacterium]
MKIIGTFGLAVLASFTLMQSAEARGGGGGGGHFGGGGAHFSGGGHYSGGAHYSGGGARYSGARSSYGGGRYYGAPRVSSMPNNRNYVSSRPRFSPTTSGLRNPTYVSGTRQFAGNNSAAYNSRVSRSSTNLSPGTRTLANRSQGATQGRVVGRYNASSWHRNWSHGSDHYWHGHRCHFHNGYWFIYDPFLYYYPWDYGYGYGYYPYDGYYDQGDYDQGDHPQEQVYTAPADTKDSNYAVDSQISDVQNALAREGYYNGAIDGRLSPATRNALRRYQRDHRLDVTGGVNQSVLHALRLQ